MANTQNVHGNLVERKAWILLAVVAGVMILFSFMMMSPVDLTAPIGGSPCCTGRVLQEVATTTPWMIDYAGELAKYMGTFALMAGILSMVLIVIPYRRQERWAWFALLTMPILFLSHGLVLGSFPFDLVPLALVILGLALPARRFFGAAHTVVRTGDRIDA